MLPFLWWNKESTCRLCCNTMPCSSVNCTKYFNEHERQSVHLGYNPQHDFVHCSDWTMSLSLVVEQEKNRRNDSTTLRVIQLTDRQLPPLPFGRICFVVLVMRKGGESSWSGPWHLGCTLEVFHVQSFQDQFIQPGWAECVFIFSLGLYFVCLCCFNLFVCPHIFVFPWTVESSPLQILALA